MTKAYSYIRFSTPEQSKGNSLDRQVALAADYAERHSLDLDTVLTFRDLGMSAYSGINAVTGELAAFKSAVERGLVPAGSYLLVESLDRISRQSVRKAVNILGDICDLGITVVTLSDEKVYTSDSLDNDQISFIMSILIFMRANEESSIKSKRLSAAWKAKRDKAGNENKPLSKVVTGWLKLNEDKTQIQVMPERADIVGGIYRDFLSGQGVMTIARNLNAAGVPTWGTGKKAATHWHSSYIAKILRNPAVIGQFTPHTLIRTATAKRRIPQAALPNYYPAIIDEITYQRVQELLENKGTKGRKVSNGVKNILSYLAKCPKCGGTVTRSSKGGPWQYLVCVRAKAKAGCEWRTAPYLDVEKAILKAVPLLLPAIKTDSPERSKLRLQIAKLERQAARYKQEISRLIGLVKSGKTDADAIVYHDNDGGDHTFITVRDEIQNLEIFINMNSAEIASLEKQYEKSNPRIVDEKFQALLDAIRTGTGIAAVNAGLRGVFSHAIVDYDRKVVLLKFKHRDAALPIFWDTKAT